MAIKYNHRKFQVRGRSEFPADMLRYDHCIAYTQADLDQIKARFNDDPLGLMWDEEHQRTKVRVITLVTWNNTAPSVGRWASFLWSVVGDSIEHLGRFERIEADRIVWVEN